MTLPHGLGFGGSGYGSVYIHLLFLLTSPRFHFANNASALKLCPGYAVDPSAIQLSGFMLEFSRCLVGRDECGRGGSSWRCRACTSSVCALDVDDRDCR